MFVPLLFYERVVLDGDCVPHVVFGWFCVLHLPLAVVTATQGPATVQLEQSCHHFIHFTIICIVTLLFACQFLVTLASLTQFLGQLYPIVPD